jgi:hypothetical protein
VFSHITGHLRDTVKTAILAIGVLAIPSLAQAEGPEFVVDPYWPKTLPNNWIMGQVAGISIDEDDNIWVLQRPRSLTANEAAAVTIGEGQTLPNSPICCGPAPSVLKFDQEGNLLSAWGGPGGGDLVLGQVDIYNGQTVPREVNEDLPYDWPATEHGILVANGFVYVGGNGATDGMLLKFTTDGEFVAQWGVVGEQTSSNDTTRFWRIADMDYDEEANEIYIADGYGNKRVAVVNADTGEIVRYWGAYGQNPVDDTSLPPHNPTSPNFASPVHCILVADSGLVYVCDRQNNRVQVFQKDGTFVEEFAFETDTRGSGSAWGLAFSALDENQEYAIMTDGVNAQIVIWRVSDGEVVNRFGRAGHNVGEFVYVHYAKTDSLGNLYSGEVDVGKRMQRWTPVPGTP